MTSLKNSDTQTGWRPTQLWTPVMISLIALMIIKLVYLSTLAFGSESLSELPTYVYIICASFILNIPEGVFRKRWMQVFIMLAIDIAAITLLSANHHMIWAILLLTFGAIWVCFKLKDTTFIPTPGRLQYCGYICVWTLISLLVYIFV